MKMYDIIPHDSRKSFYGKARVKEDDHGNKTLYSYNTPVITETTTGALVRLWGRVECNHGTAH